MRCIYAIVLGAFVMHDAASAATAAYWRHEEGPAGSLIPDGPDTVLDASGNGNHMETFSSAFTPYTSATYSTNVSPLALRSGLSNTLSLDFGTGSDGVTPEGLEPNDDNYTNAKPVAAQLFSAMTVELAFNMKSTGSAYQALFGKDGKPLGNDEGEPDSPIPPLKVMVRGDDFPGAIPNQLFVEWIDGDGDIHFLAGGETVAIDSWYHVAFTLSSTDAQLWVAGETGSYNMVDSASGQDYAAADGRVIIEEPLGYSIGRGMFGNGVTDWSNAFIDEVRLSDSVVPSHEFLFLAGPGGEGPDFDDSGTVDGDDFLIWQRGLGLGTHATGDADGNGMVDGVDLEMWKEAFGGPGLSAAPEPGGFVLCGLALAALWRRSKSR